MSAVRYFAAALALFLASAPLRAGDRLEWTGAVTQIEGSAGGGLVPWALIGGLGTADQIGVSGFATYVHTQDFSLRSFGVSTGIRDRVELSIARQRFDAASVLPGLTLGEDIAGVKVRLLGDAVFAPDQYLPQIALGAQWKRTLDFGAVPRAVGARSGSDVDLYLAATKLYFAALAGRNVIINVTLRRTRADQFGLLGFGGPAGGYHVEPEVSAALFARDDVLLGGEYRKKPNDIAVLRENGAGDAFVAWAPVKNLSLVAAWADLGVIAGKPTKHGVYLSVWVGY